MKLQHLSIFFLIIILPIIMVLTSYIDYHINAINLKYTYDNKLLDSTYDALKSYQLNTVNNSISDISASKIDELEAAVKTFYNSISTSFGYTGYKSSVMQEYVPAVVFAMYDGYYIYSPYRNVLTGVPRIDGSGNDYVDENYKDNIILEGLKSYVYYSCRYKIDDNEDYDFVITYTLDNYITVQGTVNGSYVNKYGYLIDGIEEVSADSEYKYDGCTFKIDTQENLKEYLGDTEYSYAKLNGTKYYLDNDNNEVFYINSSGEKAVQAEDNPIVSNDTFDKYKNFIEGNNSAYRYYRDAYKFTKWVRENLSNLSSEDALDASGNKINDFANYTIFGSDEDTGDNITYGPNSDKYIQDYDSDFNAHRSAVIRYTITKNLSTAIAGYNNYFKNSEVKFIMPNLSETDWEIVENNISMITFLQGFKIGGKEYNEYCVVANNLTKEYVSENDIYILGRINTSVPYSYYKINDNTIYDSNFELLNNGYAPGIWKLNFEQRVDASGDDEKRYYPLSYKQDPKIIPYLGSYSSIISSTSVNNTESDIYKYLRGITDPTKINLKKVYYTALGRERYGQYSVNNNIDISTML